MPILSQNLNGRQDHRFKSDRVDKIIGLHAKHKEIMRAVATTGLSFVQLAERFNVTAQNISDLANSEVGRAEIARISGARDVQAELITAANKQLAVKALEMLDQMVDGYVLMPDVEKLSVDAAAQGMAVLPVPPAERRRIAMGLVSEANKIIARQGIERALTSRDDIEQMKADAIAGGFVVAEDAIFEDVPTEE